MEASEASKDYEAAHKVYEYNRKAYEDRKAAADLQEAKLEALQQVLGNYGNFKYVDLEDFIDPDNQNWNDYTYRMRGDLFSKRQERIGDTSPIGLFIKQIRNAENTDDVKKQLELWDSYKPLDLPHNGESYVNHLIYGLNNAPYGGSKPVFPTSAGDTGGDTQGVVAVGGTQGSNNGSGGAQAGNTGGGTPSTQGMKTDGTGSAQTGGTGTGSTGGMQAGNSGGTGGGTYASSGVPRGGTKTIGYEYDPNPGNVSLAYAMRNAPEQERRTALINKWNQEHGISYATGKDGLIYRTDPQHPNGYVDPFKNDLSKTGSTGYATGQGMLTSGSNGTYATGEGMQSPMPVSDNWKFREAWKDPMAIIGQFGRGAFTDNEYNQLVNHAVNDLKYNKNVFSGSRFG